MNLHLLYAAIDGAHIAVLLVLAIRLLALAPRNRNVQLMYRTRFLGHKFGLRGLA